VSQCEGAINQCEAGFLIVGGQCESPASQCEAA